MKLNGKSVSPRDLDTFKKDENIVLPLEHKHVLRPRDLLDLFDTAPDLSGNDIDIARFIRSDDKDTDVQVFWRIIPDDGPPDDEPTPQRIELCNVPVGQIRIFLDGLAKKKTAVYVWEHLDDEWRKLDSKQIRPGLTILLPSSVGGYSELGWDAESRTAVTPLPPKIKIREDSSQSEPGSASTSALNIEQHTANVCRHMAEILKAIGDDLADQSDNLQNAACWHDVGKAHSAFQVGMLRANPRLKSDQFWAKSGVKKPLRYARKYFRHELASALAVLQERKDWPFMVAYIVATHHGKVRLSIRALPGEAPESAQGLFALGVQSGDELPEVKVNDDICQKKTLDLSPMVTYHPSAIFSTGSGGSVLF